MFETLNGQLLYNIVYRWTNIMAKISLLERLSVYKHIKCDTFRQVQVILGTLFLASEPFL